MTHLVLNLVNYDSTNSTMLCDCAGHCVRCQSTQGPTHSLTDKVNALKLYITLLQCSNVCTMSQSLYVRSRDMLHLQRVLTYMYYMTSSAYYFSNMEDAEYYWNLPMLCDKLLMEKIHQQLKRASQIFQQYIY